MLITSMSTVSDHPPYTQQNQWAFVDCWCLCQLNKRIRSWLADDPKVITQLETS